MAEALRGYIHFPREKPRERQPIDSELLSSRGVSGRAAACSLLCASVNRERNLITRTGQNPARKAQARMLLSRMLDARSRPPSHPCPTTSYRLPHGVPHGYLGASSHLVVPSSRPFRRGGARIALTSRIDVAMRLLSSHPSRPAASAKHTKNSNKSNNSTRAHEHTRSAEGRCSTALWSAREGSAVALVCSS